MSKADMLIIRAIKPIVDRGRDIARLVLYVSPESKLTEVEIIKTILGDLRVQVNNFLPKGMAYVLEDPGLSGRGFAWVIRNSEKGG